MGSSRAAKFGIVLGSVGIIVGCATSQVVGANVQRVVNHQSLDGSGLQKAVQTDAQSLEANLKVLRDKFEAEVAALKANAQKHWGKNDTKVASRTTYVKYTQGYKARVVTDFDHGTLTVETTDAKDPNGSLKTAIVAALLTSNDPAAVDLFTDKDVTLEANRNPYLYGLVHDSQGKSIRTRRQAEQFADYLIAEKLHTRAITSDQGAVTAHFVMLPMVRNFEAKGAEHYRVTVEKYAAQYHVSPSLVLAIIRTESNFNPFSVSGAPAYGLMQLVPTSGGRAAYKRVQGVDQTPSPDYLFDPEHNIELGVAYLSVLSDSEFHAIDNQSSRDYCVIAAYNTGAHNVTRTFSADHQTALAAINGLEPPALFERLRTSLPYEETRQYVVRVTGYRRQFMTPGEPMTASSVVTHE